MWTWTFWEQLVQDIRYGLRTMAANPLFTAMAALSLALGIGANTAIYSFMDAILLRSLPVQHPEQLVVLNWRAKDRPAVIHRPERKPGIAMATGTTSPNYPFAAFQLLRSNQDTLLHAVRLCYGVGTQSGGRGPGRNRRWATRVRRLLQRPRRVSRRRTPDRGRRRPHRRGARGGAQLPVLAAPLRGQPRRHRTAILINNTPVHDRRSFRARVFRRQPGNGSRGLPAACTPPHLLAANPAEDEQAQVLR